MLSRSAKHLYWLARYIERTENLARMIDVNLELILDYPVDHSLNWKPLIDTLDANQYYEKKYKKYNEDNVLSFLQNDFINNQCISLLNTEIDRTQFIADLNILIKELTKN